MKRVGIYIQVPFCQTRCTYCNFHTGVVSSERFAPYVEAVCVEMDRWRELYGRAGVGLGRAESSRAESGESGRREQEGLQGPKPVHEQGFAPGLKPRPPKESARPETVVAALEPSPPEQTARAEKVVEARTLGKTAIAADDIRNRGTIPGCVDDLVVADTVYIGGGTPSLLAPESLVRMMRVIRQTFGARSSQGQLAEVTLEADPETIEAEKAEAWVAAGIQRVSLGVQSFVDKELIAAGRMHRRADIYRAVAILRSAGIRNISCDLIAGLPHQTRESWRESLEQLRALEPEHISVYVLEVDRGSRLGLEILQGGTRYSAAAVPSDDDMAEFYEMACEALSSGGYHHYEISNWAKPGFESQHNLKYWRREPYLGFGAGAHSFSGTERWANAHDAADYVRAIENGRLPMEQHEILNAESALEEELFLGLRQLDGIDLGRIEREYGVGVAGRFERLVMAGLVEREGCVVRLAAGKLSVSNEVFVELMQ